MDDLDLLSEYTSFLQEKKTEGKKIVAFISHDNIPEELIDAANFIPLRLIFAGNDDLMDSSHDFLPPSTCAFAQSCIGLFSMKPDQYRFLELIDYFIVSNHCVSDICASEIICKYFNIPRLNFYVPYTKTGRSVDYFKLELQDFKSQLEKIKGAQIEDKDIIKSIQKYNNFKKVISRLNDLDVRSSKKLNLLQKAILFGPHILPQLEEFIQVKHSNSNQEYINKKNILMTGCSIFINDSMIDIIEEGGGNVILFDTWIGYNYYSQIIKDGTLQPIKDPIELLANRFENNIYGDHTVSNFLKAKISFITKFFNDFRSRTGKKLGVINHIIKFCDHFGMFSWQIKHQLQEKGIPVLNLERDYSRSIRSALETRIQAFLEML
ncbi:hypothetical protein LCGC14_1242170 [marine sediment metagenome]|uniref:2-hydroxyacyl-CoA dehydratase n=1 Tax=marine sediment metagenome TaxID=412755 RepID=A0A0F9NMN2_9ZZZZ|nr:2-hydroxyacyl-CoA dehydratase [archaeon]